MRKLIPAVLGAAVVLGAVAAQATTLDHPCTTAPQSQWLSLDTLRGKVEALGYKVQKAKIANACGELYARDKNGGRVELFVNPTNGEIVAQK